MKERKLGIAIIGLGGAVGTTIVAGIALSKKGKIGTAARKFNGEFSETARKFRRARTVFRFFQTADEKRQSA